MVVGKRAASNEEGLSAAVPHAERWRRCGGGRGFCDRSPPGRGVLDPTTGATCCMEHVRANGGPRTAASRAGSSFPMEGRGVALAWRTFFMDSGGRCGRPPRAHGRCCGMGSMRREDPAGWRHIGPAGTQGACPAAGAVSCLGSASVPIGSSCDRHCVWREQLRKRDTSGNGREVLLLEGSSLCIAQPKMGAASRARHRQHGFPVRVS